VRTKYCLLLIILFVMPSKVIAANNQITQAQIPQNTLYRLHKLQSHTEGLEIAVHHYYSKSKNTGTPLLLLHGSSFPTKLSFAFKMSGLSWTDHLVSQGFQIYALDFIGYGDSDRYPTMRKRTQDSEPLGRAIDVVADVNIAVNFILHKHTLSALNLLGHSWGGAVAAKFAEQHPNKINKLIMYAGITPALRPIKIDSNTPAYLELTPAERINKLLKLAPDPSQPLLATEVINDWGAQWLNSDPLADNNESVIYPAGPRADIKDLLTGTPLYDPSKITANVLIVRGQYDRFPSDEQASTLFKRFTNVRAKRYQVIKAGTHVTHMEKNRMALYQTVQHFLMDGAQ